LGLNSKNLNFVIIFKKLSNSNQKKLSMKSYLITKNNQCIMKQEQERTELYDCNTFFVHHPKNNLVGIDEAKKTTMSIIDQRITAFSAVRIGSATAAAHYRVPTVAAPSIRQEVTHLVVKGRMEEAINCTINYAQKLQDNSMTNDLYMLSGRYQQLRYSKLQGVITSDDEIMERNQVTNNLLRLIEQLSD
jgi:hypothetical protein